MAKVRIGYDGGACIIVGGVPYGKVTSPVQPTSGAVNASPTTANISAQGFRYDDSNVEYGGNHLTWTACEIGISKYIPANVSTVTLVTAGVYYTLYTALSAGTLKTHMNPNVGDCWKINGTIVFCKSDWTGDRGSTYSNSLTLLLALGDVVSCCSPAAGNVAYGYFLPNVYP